MVKIIGRDGQNLNEIQTDVNRYMLAEVIWRSNNEARRTWTLLAVIINTRSQHIPGDWTLRPHFHTRPLQRHGTILWILAHPVCYRTQYHNQTTTQNYADFLRQACWKAHSKDLHQKSRGLFTHDINGMHPDYYTRYHGTPPRSTDPTPIIYLHM